MTTGSTALTAIYGGTFDPVHYGHLRAAVEVRAALNCDDFRFVPAGYPPHRPAPVAGGAERLALLRAALVGHAELHLDEREIHRPGPSYMADTLDEIRREIGPAAPLALIVGQDAANALDRWHRWPDLLAVAHLVVMTRPENPPRYAPDLAAFLEQRTAAGPEALSATPAGLVLPLMVTQLAIASSDIRARIARRADVSFLLPDPAIKVIFERGLYGALKS